jgi:hypothetical protein
VTAASSFIITPVRIAIPVIYKLAGAFPITFISLPTTDGFLFTQLKIKLFIYS